MLKTHISAKSVLYKEVRTPYLFIYTISNVYNTTSLIHVSDTIINVIYSYLIWNTRICTMQNI